MNEKFNQLAGAVKTPTTAQLNERLHHPYSPSKLGALEACPSYTGEQGESTAASLAGTKQHDAVENRTLGDDLEDHEAEAVQQCIDYGDRVAAKYPGATIIKEEYLFVDNEIVVDSKGVQFTGTTGGYCDLVILSADQKTGEVLDYKFGKWSVEDAATNLQGIAYLLGVWRRFPKMETCTVTFLMPHQDTVDSHTFTRDEFPALLLRVKTVVARAIEATKAADYKTACATVAGCLFCGNKGKCAKVTSFCLKLGSKYAPLLIPENVTPSLLSDPKTSTQLMEISQVMAGWAKAVRTQITERAISEDGWLPEGYVLRKREDKEITSWKKLLSSAKAAGLTREQRREGIKMSMTPLYKGIQDNAPKGDKKKAKEAWVELLLAEGILVKEEPVIFLERIKS